MKYTDVYRGKYLKASDLQGKTVKVAIDSVTLEDVGNGKNKEEKLVVMFRGKDRGLVLNKTNAAMIAEITGTDEIDEWEGKLIAIYPDKTDFGGERVDCIRVNYPAGSKPIPPPAVDGDGDDIGF